MVTSGYGTITINNFQELEKFITSDSWRSYWIQEFELPKAAKAFGLDINVHTITTKRNKTNTSICNYLSDTVLCQLVTVLNHADHFTLVIYNRERNFTWENEEDLNQEFPPLITSRSTRELSDNFSRSTRYALKFQQKLLKKDKLLYEMTAKLSRLQKKQLSSQQHAIIRSCRSTRQGISQR